MKIVVCETTTYVTPYFTLKFGSLHSHLMNFAKLRQAKILKKIIKRT